MAVRDDIYVRWDRSPRVVVVQAPSTEVTVQDLYDTLRDFEDEPANLIYPRIISAGGKEDLGGGTAVGITATLLNARLAFEERRVVRSTGTITDADPTGVTLTDTGATFIADGVDAGDVVQNVTDGSFATVVQVISNTQLQLLTALGAGVDNQFEVGDSYRVFDWVRCNVSGGNVVAVDDLGATIPETFETFGTQVNTTKSSAATTQNQFALEHATFGQQVTVDTASPYSGTEFPTGTPLQPVNNLTDALAIAAARGFDTIFLRTSVTLTGADFTGFHFIGNSQSQTVITLDPSATLVNCEFSNATVQGTLDGDAELTDCLVGTITVFSGLVSRCGLQGTITLGGGAAAIFSQCYDALAGFGTPEIDLGGSGQSLLARAYHGGVSLSNKTGTDEVSIDGDIRVVINSTVTNGTVLLRGTGSVTDNSTGSAVVTASDLVNPTSILERAAVALGSAAAGATPTSVPTDVNRADHYFRGAVVEIEDGTDRAVRRAEDYLNTNGEFVFNADDPLPFTPSAGASVRVLAGYRGQF